MARIRHFWTRSASLGLALILHELDGRFRGRSPPAPRRTNGAATISPWKRYAPESLGMSARKARALLRLERDCEACPELRAAYRRGRLSWVKAHCLLPLLLLDLDGAYRSNWVAWAERVTVRRLERDV